MINISTNRNLKPLADAWCDDLRHFLMDTYEGNKRPYKVVKGRRKYFNTRLSKYKYELYCKCKEEGFDRKQRCELWAHVRKFVSDFNCNIKADEERITRLALEQDGWKNSLAKSVVKDVFVQIYEDFIHYDDPDAQKEIGYKYMELINVRTCPYCNRQYTFTIRRDENSEDHFCTRPEFDHFYEKSHYPLLALTFFNLVPSCHECNHGKQAKFAGVNPYFKGFSSKFCITNSHREPLNRNEILNIKRVDDFTLDFANPSENEMKNIELFGLRRRYHEHRDYVQEIIEKSVTYDAVLEQGILEAFQGVFRSSSDVRQFVWGKYLEESDYENRPLSKLTGDILEQLGIKK